jgi:phenylalanyl-tRNA synthetase alpha chain
VKWLGTKGIVKNLMSEMRNVPIEQKKQFGKVLNDFKVLVESKFEELKQATSDQRQEPGTLMDLSLPGDPVAAGSRHPVSLMRNRIVSIFQRLGFAVAEGPEIEDDWHNFTALNTPLDHPAREMQDTFFLTEDKNWLLRTHTSSVQIRKMESEKPPMRYIFPGRVFRNETISARAHCTFHQVEGLYIDEDVSFADLKQTMTYFSREMFGKNTEFRFRPSFFPFTEPSAEMDISCLICNQKGCAVCKHTGWVEIGGCGMVDPDVMENCKLDPKKYSGFAFGVGIERIAMLNYQINDLRLFFENDIRFLKQFTSAI